MNRRFFLLAPAALAVASTAVARVAFNAMPDTSVQFLIKVLDHSKLLPVGTILPWAGRGLPPGWLPMDGRSLSRALYPELFAAIGNNYTPAHWYQRLLGERFRLPDLRNHYIEGRG